ncbi:uncharacterized protein LOC133294895, partial [Gastrolobium bilobum]|uniref:uncharacterized protein LOC133294895 n=1 Tax=Gastrolobium bilobum TaxID=150636 RepID=UPI002AB26E7D
MQKEKDANSEPVQNSIVHDSPQGAAHSDPLPILVESDNQTPIDEPLRNISMEKSMPKGQPTKSNVEAPVVKNRPLPPFPQRLQKQKQDNRFRKFLDLLKQLHVNIPFVDALEQMPTYVKLMKEIISRKRRLEEFETVALTQESSQYLLSKIPPKLGDPGSFTILCTIGDHYIGRALCDVGASINLMPLSVYKKLKVGEPNPTTVTLQLADRSLVYPEGKVENVLVKVDKFILPADFIILDYEEDREVPIILGRAFLATGGAVIDVKEGELAMNVNVKDKFLRESSLDSLQNSGFEGLEISQTDSEEVVKWLNSRTDVVWKNKKFESLELAKRGLKLPKPSIEEPPVLELKPLLNHL